MSEEAGCHACTRRATHHDPRGPLQLCDEHAESHRASPAGRAMVPINDEELEAATPEVAQTDFHVVQVLRRELAEAQAKIEKLLDRLTEVERERDAARAALPEPWKLLVLTNWLDELEQKRRGPGPDGPGAARSDEVQQDLRRWARDAQEILYGG